MITTRQPRSHCAAAVLGFSLKGNVIIVTGNADATLKIKLTYDTPKPTP